MGFQGSSVEKNVKGATENIDGDIKQLTERNIKQFTADIVLWFTPFKLLLII